MSVEENKALLQRWVDEWNQGNPDVDALFAPEFVDHSATSGEPRDLKAWKQYGVVLRNAFPDLYFTVQDVIAEGDKVMARWTAHGTHSGTFAGIPATSKQISINAMAVFRVADGKFVERWSVSDYMGMLQQLGIMPAPGQNEKGA